MAIEWDKNTLFLLHGETLEDSSFYAVPITNNGVQVSTEQSKFGGSSFYFSGSKSYLSFPASVTDFGESDFTYDWWEFPVLTTASAFCNQNVAPTGIVMGYNGKGLKLNSDYSAPGFDLVNDPSAFSSKEAGVWTHWAVVRYKNTINVYKNGTRIYSKDIGSVSLKINTAQLARIGTNPGLNQFFNGYIDEFRISNISRWTEDFTPPTEPYQPYTEIEFASKLDWSVSDYLNHDDLTRIERNCKILNDKLLEYGYIAPIDFRQWAVGEYPTPTQLERIRSNINALQDVWFAIPEWRELMAVYRPDGRETINAEQVNAQEWDLQQMYDYLQAMVMVFDLKQAGTPFMIAGGLYNAG